MRDESQALTIRQNGDATLSPEKTKAIWASAGAGTNPELNRALGVIGDHYRLDPALGEVQLMGNKVYITFEGYLRIAEQNPSYEGYELNPMTEQERKDAKVGPDEFAYVCKVYRKDRRFPSVGYGVASDRTVQMTTMKVFLREMAEKRAFYRALKMAFRAGIPDLPEESEYLQVVNVPALPSPVEPAEVPQVAPDWPKFWVHVKGMGVDADEVHRVLGVESVRDWPGSLHEAIDTIEQYVLMRDVRPERSTPAQQVAEAVPQAPQPPQTPPTDLATSAQVRAIYELGRKQKWTERETEQTCRDAMGAVPVDLTRAAAAGFIKSLQAAAG